MDRPMFGIFEGGGARGIAHIGAVSACEDNGFFFVGVAGASAGAIIATLVAAGFDANDILNPDELTENILYRYDKTPIRLLGEGDWKRYLTGRNVCAPLIKGRGVRARKRAILLFPQFMQMLVETWRQKGHFSTADIRSFLNGVLRDQLTKVRESHGDFEPAPARITFADLDWRRYAEFLPLKIMAANVSTQEGVIFDLERTPDAEIAQAVAASIAIPIVFRPVVMALKPGEGHQFIDGGAVSNLPVWVFADEKLAYERANPGPPVPVVGFTLKPARAAAGHETPLNPDGFLNYLQRGAATALSGSQRVIQEFVEDLRVITLETGLTTLQFDASETEIVKCYRDGYDCAARELRHHLVEQPALIRLELQRIYDRVRAELIKQLAAERRREAWVLRANIVQRFGRDAFRVTYGVNMDDDSDDRLPLDRDWRGAPRAFSTGAPIFSLINARQLAPDADLMTKYERALLRRDITAIISVPIYADAATWRLPVEKRPQPCGVLSFDSDRHAELENAFDDLDFRALLITQSTLLYPAMTKEMTRG